MDMKTGKKNIVNGKRKYIITFDLDETLIHAKRCHWKAFNEAFEKFDLKKIKYQKLIPFLNGRHAHQVVRDLFPKLSEKEVDKITKEHHKLISIKYGKYAKKIKGVVPVLKKLKKIYKIGMISNCTHKEINSLMRGAGLKKSLFDIIIGKDDVKRSKPYPDELFKAEKLMRSDIKFHVGDSPFDIIAARRSNTKAIAVLTGVNSKRILKKEKPFAIIKDINELPKVLEKLKE